MGIESLLDYSLANDLELLLFSPINYDINTKEIYEKSNDALREVLKSINKTIFSVDDFSDNLFLLKFV